VVIQPLADDIAAELSADKIVVTRPAGLTLSNASARTSAPLVTEAGRRIGGLFTLDPQTWGFDREGDYRDRQMHLVTAAAGAEEGRRMVAQLELARFYLARRHGVSQRLCSTSRHPMSARRGRPPIVLRASPTSCSGAAPTRSRIFRAPPR
jgi:hypothetical protein